MALKEICPCIIEHYQVVFISALSCSIAEFEKLSATLAKHEPEGRESQEFIRKVIDNYKRIRDEVEALPICEERK